MEKSMPLLTLFQNGEVSSKHLTKLFAPDTVVVAYQSKEPCAFTADGCIQMNSSRVQLFCRSWGFDGRIFEERTSLFISCHLNVRNL
ncbi:hypothetical protein BJY04DRAFT_194474, partial [Aspergillus karnatakaensis]|uniref:uncharacterized protein n=1 Tax=Aspergillus karnatakaensis TaxID=1810916 RepID=UPI003CCDAB3D